MQTRHGASDSPADEIAASAWQESVDMIVIATHGLSRERYLVCGDGIETITFGSVTSNVLRPALCPVLTVRIPPLPAQA